MLKRERLRGIGTDKTERMFFQAIYELDFITITTSPSIRSPHPVADKNEVVKKTVTQPDFLITRLETGQTMFVEITASSGNLPAKEAQLRVVQAAGVTNYIQLSGDQVHMLSKLTPEARLKVIFQLFGWK
ncbi:hypothetical protein KBC89_01510 [Candidatus Woesebacteria bacterium]|nr:hypothetical protein [Candidatus Woesebacteria bacterium]